jgi:hypothetical protein
VDRHPDDPAKIPTLNDKWKKEILKFVSKKKKEDE